MLSLALVFLPLAKANTPLFTAHEYQSAFKNWTEKYNKGYTVGEFFGRYATFKENVDFVARHNIGGYSYSVELNEFADMTNEEFKKYYLGFKPAARTGKPMVYNDNITLPDAVDWSSKGAVTPIKNQGQCGSCWAFSTTGSTEGAYYLKHGTLKSFSEQQLVDCAGSYGNMGCNGGLMDDGFQYAEKKGLCTEGDYSYSGQDGTCKESNCKTAVYVSSYTDVPKSNLDALASAVAQAPVSVAVDAGGLGWQFYSGGVFSGGIFGCGTSLDHGVLAVGYGSSSSDYWKVKNSWGASWGENGYIRIKKTSGTGSGVCGIALSASYPTVA
ncbi:hypothetical protein AAMO2058_000459500 [Amorphochlora amoebiformis]|uniref:Uncharacterized protein n=1 Tax=Amorphochlora amoebiformis TaxID=1561963 RepID=A0A7S0D1P9_9EUKA|mmetsp:Transcript_17660/g.28153  ORF Transcript_17660/g.28153 Transcript_17660/m.28153 type:complete len:327 (+) Transcript_17660:32-1012(+)